MVNTGYAYTTIIGSIILMGCWIAQSEILFYAALSSIFQSFLNVQLSVRQCQKKGLVLCFYSIFTYCYGSCIYCRIALSIIKMILLKKRILVILLSNLVVGFFSYFLYRKSTTSKKYQFKHYQSALFYILGFDYRLFYIMQVFS